MFGPEMICPQCKKPFRQGKHNQRFCQPQCKDDFHNAEKMIAYRLRKAEEEEDRRQARLDRTPLNEIVERLKSKPDAEERGATANGGEHKPLLSEIIQALPKPETLPKLEPMKRRAF